MKNPAFQGSKPVGYYEIINEFTEGLVAGISRSSGRELCWSNHKLAGYDAGYAMRKEKNAQIDKYLISIGQRPQSVIKLA